VKRLRQEEATRVSNVGTDPSLMKKESGTLIEDTDAKVVQTEYPVRYSKSVQSELESRSREPSAERPTDDYDKLQKKCSLFRKKYG